MHVAHMYVQYIAHCTQQNSLFSALLEPAVYMCTLQLPPKGLQLEECPPVSGSALAPTESVTDILTRVQSEQLPQEVAYSTRPVPSDRFRRKQSAPAAVTAMSLAFNSGQRFGSGEFRQC